VINRIDLTSVLRRTVCEVYSDLVTRPTGAAVRAHIEQQLTALEGRTLTVIDFSNVGLLDFSCADEVVAKLLLRFYAGTPRQDAYFAFQGVSESHYDALEAVLERHDLALVVLLHGGAAQLIGTIGDSERRAWQDMYRLGRATVEQLADALGVARDEAQRLLDTLHHRRLVMRFEQEYVALGGVE
jgi:hypothetical protein